MQEIEKGHSDPTTFMTFNKKRGALAFGFLTLLAYFAEEVLPSGYIFFLLIFSDFLFLTQVHVSSLFSDQVCMAWGIDLQSQALDNAVSQG